MSVNNVGSLASEACGIFFFFLRELQFSEGQEELQECFQTFSDLRLRWKLHLLGDWIFPPEYTLKFSYHWTTTKDEDFTLLLCFFLWLSFILSLPPLLSLCVCRCMCFCVQKPEESFGSLIAGVAAFMGCLSYFMRMNPNSGLYECTVSPLSPGATSLALAKLSCTCSLTFPPCYVTKQRPHEMMVSCCQPSQLPELWGRQFLCL